MSRETRVGKHGISIAKCWLVLLYYLCLHLTQTLCTATRDFCAIKMFCHRQNRVVIVVYPFLIALHPGMYGYQNRVYDYHDSQNITPWSTNTTSSSRGIERMEEELSIHISILANEEY